MTDGEKDCKILKVVIILACTSLLLLIPANNFYNNDNLTQKMRLRIEGKPREVSYTSHDPISISNDAELAAIAIGGTGTSTDPYILGGWNITTNSDNGILISDTASYFIIRDCWIKTSSDFDGILIVHVVSGTTIIKNNICINNWRGISLLESRSSLITNNSCSHNYYTGISLCESESSVVANNFCNQNNGDGFSLSFSSYSIIVNNTFNNNAINGIHLSSSSAITIVNNTFVNNGLRLYGGLKSDYFGHTVDNNFVNGFALGYFENLKNCDIVEIYGQLILRNCTDVQIKNQNCSNGSIGISLFFCSECSISNSIFSNNTQTGILLVDSAFLSLINNICNKNTETGIFIDSSNSLTIINNTCNLNNENGISFIGSKSYTVNNNNCSRNYNGILLITTDYGSISWNYFVENQLYGLRLASSRNCLVHHNCFIDNNGSYSQAYDSSTSTKWYDPDSLEGNYWSDYNGTGTYAIAGNVGAIDPYPLLIYPSKTSPVLSSDSTSTIPLEALGLVIVLSLIFAGMIIGGYGLYHSDQAKKIIVSYFENRSGVTEYHPQAERVLVLYQVRLDTEDFVKKDPKDALSLQREFFEELSRIPDLILLQFVAYNDRFQSYLLQLFEDL